MTVTLSTARQALPRFGVAALLLGAGLLIGSVRPVSAGEIMPTPVSATPSQVQGVSQPDPRFAPTQNTSTPDPRPLGVTGFGWG